MLSVFLFPIALKKRILIFFFVFVWNLENGLQVVFCSTRNRRTKSLFKTSSNAAILVSLQSKYSARSAYYSRMTFMNRERIVLFILTWIFESSNRSLLWNVECWLHFSRGNLSKLVARFSIKWTNYIWTGVLWGLNNQQSFTGGFSVGWLRLNSTVKRKRRVFVVVWRWS